MDSGLDKAITAAGGMASLAKRLGTTIQVVSNWRMRGQVPAGRCRDVEMATGVACEDLRPDVFGRPVKKSARRRVS
jgi:DNA-binding transcriptional regulator YdaS (Cro superfamily)